MYASTALVDCLKLDIEDVMALMQGAAVYRFCIYFKYWQSWY